MKTILRSIWGFVKSEDGPTAVEYAVMLMLIILVCVGAIATMGQATNDSLTDSANRLP